MLIKMSNTMMLILFLGIFMKGSEAATLNTEGNTNLSSNFLSNSDSENLNTVQMSTASNMLSSHSKSSLFITGSNDKSALINLKIRRSHSIFSIGLFKKEFVIMSAGDKKLIRVQADKSSVISGTSLMTNSIKIKGEVKFQDQTQWKMIVHDSFHKNHTALGWSLGETTDCKTHKMLGGYCQTSTKELIKEIDNLPSHTMVRIEANFHFLGTWDSHSGYLKIDLKTNLEKNEKYIWAQRCRNQKSPLANIKMCSVTEVCKMGAPINSTINHKEKKIKFIFGSTLTGNPCDQSYGISDFKVYVR